MTLLEQIGARYQEMTLNEKRIFDLMTEDAKTFALLSIGDIAGRLDLSKTTVLRFAKGCGFKGYTDFRRSLQQEVILDVSPVRKLQKIITDDYHLNTDELCRQEISNINQTLSALNEKSLTSLADKIIDAGELYTLSWGISNHLAEIFAVRMKMMGIRCLTITRKHGTLIEETSLVKSNDLMLIFEVPPYNREMVETVKVLHDRAIDLILITDSARCPLTRFTARSFYCPTDALFFGNSLVGPLFFVNLITSLIIYKRKDKVLEILEDQQKIFNDNRYYHQTTNIIKKKR